MKRKTWILAAIVLMGLALFISLKVVDWYENPGNSDFLSFWLSGRLILQGLDPYSTADWLQGHETYQSTWISDQTSIYPLPLAALFVPLGLLDLRTAFVVWVFLSLLMLFTSIAFLLRSFGQDARLYVIPVIAGVILFRPLTSLLLNGQISAMLLLFLVAATVLWEKKHWLWGGLVLSLTLLKPQIGVFAAGLAGFYILRKKQYAALAGMGVGALSLLLMGVLLNPTWVSEYIAILLTKYNQTFGYTPNIWGLSFLIFDFETKKAVVLGAVVSALLVLGYLVTLWKTEPLTPEWAMGFAIPITLLVTPYLWPYEQILLIFPILIAMTLLKKLGVKFYWTALYFIFLSIVSYALFWSTIQIEVENLNGLLTLIVLFTYGIIFTLMQRISKHSASLSA